MKLASISDKSSLKPNNTLKRKITKTVSKLLGNVEPKNEDVL